MRLDDIYNLFVIWFECKRSPQTATSHYPREEAGSLQRSSVPTKSNQV